MAQKSRAGFRLHCLGCGRQDAADGEWDAVKDPRLGTLTRCPDCGSTNIEHVVK